MRLRAAREPEAYLCPITHTLMVEPAVCADGHTYERAAIERWFQTRTTSPLTGEELESKHLVKNHALRAAIAAHRGAG